MSVSRREFIKNASLASVGITTLSACSSEGINATNTSPTAPGNNPTTPATQTQASFPFKHSVASGDPLADRVILWTRVSPEQDATIFVNWKVATDTAMSNVVASGTVTTNNAVDYTVKIDPTGLSAGTTYYYQFSALGHDSQIARTKTLPTGSVDRIRLGLVSCASLVHGFFNAYRFASQRLDLDAIIHLGDYVYEYPGVDPAAADPDDYADQAAIDAGRQYSEDNRVETVTLTDYRLRHANYKLDQDLQKLHLQFPFITIWDDHEFADNTWTGGAFNHQSEDGDWPTRRASAIQAYFEWMPIRALPGLPGKIDRAFAFGDLADLVMFDTRVTGRQEQPGTSGADRLTPGRRLITQDQEDWVLNELRASKQRGTKWRLLGQQVMLAQLRLVDDPFGDSNDQLVNDDQWDGYFDNRTRIFNALRGEAIDNTVVLTGDIHTSWALDLHEDPSNPFNANPYNPVNGDNAIGVEFVVPSITSPGMPELNAVAGGLMQPNPHLKYVDLAEHGYVVLDVDKDRVQAEWYYTDDILTENGGAESLGTSFKCDDGANRLSAGTGATAPQSATPAAPG